MVKLLVIVLYCLVIFTIGLIASKRIKTSKDFILGSREFSALTTALGAGAADMGAWLMMALPGLAFITGMSAIWLPIGCSIGAYLNWQYVAGPLRVETHKHGNALTLPGYLSNRLNDHSGTIKLVTAVMMTIFFVIYIASALVALSLLIQSFTSFEYIYCLIAGTIFIFLYTSVGGFVAINWIDVLQGGLMLFALLIVPIAILADQTTLSTFFDKINGLDINLSNPFANIGFISIISSLGWGLGYAGQPHILMRFMSIKNPTSLKLSKTICMSWMIISLIGALCVGFFGKLIFSSGQINPETVFLLSADMLFPEWLAGLVLAAVLSAIMSSISAQLHATSSSITEDLLPKFFQNKEGHIWVTRLSMLLIILVSAIYAYAAEDTVLGLVAFAWSGLGSAFGPAILFALYSKKMTRDSALYGIATGGLVVLIWHFCKGLGGIFELYEIIPGFLISSAVIIVKSNKNLTIMA